VSRQPRTDGESCDVVIVGGGAAGLSLALRLTGSTSSTVTLVEPPPDGPLRPRERTWCYWDHGTDDFDEAVSASWARLRVHGTDGRPLAVCPSPLTYRMLRSTDFERLVHSRIARSPATRIPARDGRHAAQHGRRRGGTVHRPGRPHADTAGATRLRLPAAAHAPTGPDTTPPALPRMVRAHGDGPVRPRSRRSDGLPGAATAPRTRLRLRTSHGARPGPRRVHRVLPDTADHRGVRGGAGPLLPRHPAARHVHGRVGRGTGGCTPAVRAAGPRHGRRDAAGALDTRRIDGPGFFTDLFRRVPPERLLRFLDGDTSPWEEWSIGLRTPVGPMLRTAMELPFLPRRPPLVP
jgi:lycopene beta-cyclase